MNKIKAFLAGLLLVAVTLLPLSVANAVDANIIANPSLETASGTAPASWSKDAWGTNTATYTYETTGHTGTRSATVKLASYKSGDAKWYPAPVTATPNTTYAFSDWYKSTAKSSIDAVVTTTTGTTSYFWMGDLAVSSAWKQASYSFKAPANAKTVTFYHYIMSNGSLTVDDYSLTAPGTTTPPVVTPTAPTVSITAPANNATVVGNQVVTANAADAQSVTSVQFKLDGANLGAADTTAPYSAAWNTTASTNGTHVLTAVATNAANLTTTASNVTVTVNNAVIVTPTAPTVAFTTPAANATVAGTTTVAATASGAQAISKVVFSVDGTVAATVTAAPYSFAWNTTALANGAHTLTAVATNSANLTATATETVTVANPTAPVVAVTAPANNAVVTGTQAVSATATSNVAISSVQFKLDGVNLGAADTTAPYSVNWDTKTATNAAHVLTAVAVNAANQSTTATNVNVTVNNPTAPVVAVTAPAANATVTGTQAVTATATSNVAITSVQFKLDGANLGAPVTTAPYSFAWDTTTAVNGAHTLTAVATNAAAQSTTAANVAVTVNNTVVVTPPTTGANLIANPSVETAAGTLPQAWASNAWGTNTVTFSYLNTGHTGTHSLKTDVTAYTDGDAKWAFADVNVTAGKTYQYENWYQSNVDSEVDAAITMTDGSTQYYYITTASASATWAKVSGQITIPTGAKSITLFQVLAKKGFVINDDFSLAEYTPSGFANAMVSLTFDDGWLSQYTNAKPVLDKYGVKATFYLLTETIDYPDYMTVANMQALMNDGQELDSHTVSHPHLPTLTVAQVDNELANSQTQLRSWFGSTVADDFATPYGEYNASTITEIKKYYRSHRSTDEGFNSKDNFDIYNIKVQNILNTTTAAQVAAWVDQAQREHTWLVLVYHEVATAVEDPTYSISPTDLDVQIAAMKAKGISIVTLGQAINAILPQL